jgi:hypothetical protein
MTASNVTSVFSIMCDEVRIENNLKFMIIGMYTPDMSVTQLPYIVPVLTFLFWLEGRIPNNYPFNAKLSHLESGAVIAQAMGAFGLLKPGRGLAPIRLVGLQFTQPGPYTFSLQIQNEPEILHQFSVLLITPVMPTLPGVPGMPQFGR